MKKTSKAMRIACALAIATAMSTCVVAGTLAKYTAGGSSSDTASVAKWGVKVSGSNDAFAKSYKDPQDTAVTVSSNGKVIAPGTKGTLSGTEVSGTPEVSVNVSNSATVTTKNWTEGYLPIKVKIGDDTVTGNDAASLTSAINEKLAAYDKKNVSVGTPLTGTGAPNLEWSWDYDGVNGANDIKDNVLGNAAAEGTAVPEITISVTTTVTQVD